METLKELQNKLGQLNNKYYKAVDKNNVSQVIKIGKEIESIKLKIKELGNNK